MNKKRSTTKRLPPKPLAKNDSPPKDPSPVVIAEAVTGRQNNSSETTRRKALLEETEGLIKTFREKKKAAKLQKLLRDAAKEIARSGKSKSVPTE